MLLKNQDPRLAAFVVWVPELGAQEHNVARGTKLVPDSRASQYWDPSEMVGTEYGRLLRTPGAAWDVYMLFGAQAVWPKSGVPKPGFWMQQLDGVTAAPRLDGGVFAARAAAMLAQVR
ncbi:MAG: hypothetical protein GIW99_01340 [Candidatus Eremiobacteraeota bacterium]|nr:hypothetical protein [Candidatus Eremiobacteraeota bacterium]